MSSASTDGSCLSRVEGCPNSNCSPAGKIGVVLVDDNRSVLQSVRQVLEASPDIECRAAYSEPRAALLELRSAMPQVILMDVRMPGTSEIDCTRQIKAASPAVCVIMLTGLDDVRTAAESLDAGASGYLLKDCCASHLEQSILCATRGATVLSNTIAVKLARVRVKRISHPDLDQLSRRESQVAELLAEGQPDKLVADRLTLSIHRVKEIKRSLYVKWGVHTRSEAAVKFVRATIRL